VLRHIDGREHSVLVPDDGCRSLKEKSAMYDESTLTSWSDDTWPDYGPDMILPGLFQGVPEDDEVVDSLARDHQHASAASRHAAEEVECAYSGRRRGGRSLKALAHSVRKSRPSEKSVMAKTISLKRPLKSPSRASRKTSATRCTVRESGRLPSGQAGGLCGRCLDP